jgi:hypothetical protein
MYVCSSVCVRIKLYLHMLCSTVELHFYYGLKKNIWSIQKCVNLYNCEEQVIIFIL